MISNVAGDRLYQQIKDRLNDSYENIHQSGNWIDGVHCRSAEEKIKKITGRKHARLLSSCTSSLMVALLSWDIRNKKVACSNYSYVASASQAALINGVEFMDVDNKGLISLEKQFTHDAVIPVSLYGNTIDYDNLKYFEEYVDKSFDLKYLIFVTNQYGPDRISVYGFVEDKLQ